MQYNIIKNEKGNYVLLRNDYKIELNKKIGCITFEKCSNQVNLVLDIQLKSPDAEKNFDTADFFEHIAIWLRGENVDSMNVEQFKWNNKRDKKIDL